ARWRHSSVNQLRDVRMCQAAQNATFAFESLLAALPHQSDAQHLYRDASFKPPIVSFRQPNGAHSTMADLRNQRVDTKSLACEARPSRQFQGTYFEKTFVRQNPVLTKQYFQLSCQRWIL